MALSSYHISVSKALTAPSTRLQKYLIKRRLAHALFGDVLLCLYTPSKEMVAVKRVLLTSAAAQVTLMTRRRVRESVAFELGMYRALKALNGHGHENVIRMLDEIEHDGYLYIVLEFCARGELFDVIQSSAEGRLDTMDAARYFRQIINGVRYLHQSGYAHRDLSLENVLLTDDDECKICDFGLASPAQSACSEPVGKAFYMAPEMIQGRYYDPIKADIWSLGIMLFIMLTGSPPVEAARGPDSRYRIIASHGVQALLQKLKIKNEIPSTAIDLLNKMLCVEPQQRISLSQVAQHPFLAENSGDFVSVVFEENELFTVPMYLGGNDNFLAITLYHLLQKTIQYVTTKSAA
uniref:Protein kinase putative n=1 Tax=Albugo laibachii Nc14 TaxID=890382 RepID=F0WJ56_9STRA|nr:protein kinase putative [Albugo laibachii Nc14]|eukprot:CCA21302.1 protein kinase putative [Albugo laibachii Nc14]